LQRLVVVTLKVAEEGHAAPPNAHGLQRLAVVTLKVAGLKAQRATACCQTPNSQLGRRTRRAGCRQSLLPPLTVVLSQPLPLNGELDLKRKQFEAIAADHATPYPKQRPAEHSGRMLSRCAVSHEMSI
jgi:hypothetical protein